MKNVLKTLVLSMFLLCSMLTLKAAESPIFDMGKAKTEFAEKSAIVANDVAVEVTDTKEVCLVSTAFILGIFEQNHFKSKPVEVKINKYIPTYKLNLDKYNTSALNNKSKQKLRYHLALNK